MNKRSEELAWCAIQLDDIAVLLRDFGLPEIADQLEDARDLLEGASLAPPIIAPLATEHYNQTTPA